MKLFKVLSPNKENEVLNETQEATRDDQETKPSQLRSESEKGSLSARQAERIEDVVKKREENKLLVNKRLLKSKK